MKVFVFYLVSASLGLLTGMYFVGMYKKSGESFAFL